MKSQIVGRRIETNPRDERAVSSPPRSGAVRPTAMRAGLLALGSFYSPRLLSAQGGNGRIAAFVPDYSGGTAVDLHHLPFCLPTQETRIANVLSCQPPMHTAVRRLQARIIRNTGACCQPGIGEKKWAVPTPLGTTRMRIVVATRGAKPSQAQRPLSQRAPSFEGPPPARCRHPFSGLGATHHPQLCHLPCQLLEPRQITVRFEKLSLTNVRTCNSFGPTSWQGCCFARGDIYPNFAPEAWYKKPRKGFNV